MLIKKVLINETGQVVKSPSPSPKLPTDIPNKEPSGLRVNRVSLEPRIRRTQEIKNLNGHWLFDEQLGVHGEFGFIYLIHDTVNNKRYIGKKQFYGTGKANKGDVSNWRTYTSSSKAVQQAITDNGKDSFKFYVVEQYKIRGTLGYAETWSLMYCETPANQDKWYNSLVNKISWRVKEGISTKHRFRLRMLAEGRADQLEVWDGVADTRDIVRL